MSEGRPFAFCSTNSKSNPSRPVAHQGHALDKARSFCFISWLNKYMGPYAYTSDDFHLIQFTLDITKRFLTALSSASFFLLQFVEWWFVS